MSGQKEITILADSQTLSRSAADLFVHCSKEAISRSGRFAVALSGGSTPKALCSLLASAPFRDQIDWANVHLFWGDERSVPPEHKDSNYGMAKAALIDHVPVPPANVYRMVAEKSDVKQAATEYEELLRNFFPNTEFPRFDLIYLGMGDDGHTASLFPGTTALKETNRWVVENYVPKFQTYRVTLTAPLINHAALVAFLISGESKAAVLKEVFEGPQDPDRLPSQLIQPSDGKLLLLLDEAAAAQLKR